MCSVKTTSSTLLKVQLNVVPVDRCNGSYTSSIGSNLTRGIEDDSQICAGHSEGGKDTCGVSRFLLYLDSERKYSIFTKSNSVFDKFVSKTNILNTRHFFVLFVYNGEKTNKKIRVEKN